MYRFFIQSQSGGHMLRRNLIIICAALYLAVFAAIAQAQLPQITSGLNYLTSSQNSDGTWATTTAQAETTVTTITVLETLKLLNQTAGSAYASATAWLQAQAPVTVDYIAERIRALALTDNSINVLFPSIDTRKGAWGGDEGYLTNNLDTALALQALKTANYTDITTISTALGYLTSTQNPDGGWGFSASDPSPGSGQADSNIYTTAIVSTTLQQFAQSYNLATTITKASAYLASWQNPDGGFGVTSGMVASTTFETALAYIALVNDGQTQGLPLQNAINFLTTTQALNGSWNDDPYSTALALKALYISENLPAPPPPAATTGSVMGTVVDETSNAPLAGVAIVLTGSSTFSATSDASGKFSLSGIPVGSQQITFTAAGYAPLTITATVSAGTISNLGNIGLSANPTSGIVQGVVWDVELNAPYPGATVQAQSGGNTYQSVSGADGSYRISNVPAGTITGTTSGLKPGYLNVTFTGELAAGGILIYNPRLAKVPAPSAALYLKTNQALYKKGDNVALTVDIQNNVATGYAATLQLNITDPSGVSVYSSSAPVNLTAQALLTQTASFTLPTTGQGGFYAVQAELYDANNAKLATVATNFGMVMSQIAVTPKLPAQFTQGANNVIFDLVNKGSIAITSGALAVTLKDPDGVLIATSSQPFSLTQGGSATLTCALTFPPLKFGAYTLSYTQSDETTNGQAVAISLANTLDISPLFDKPSYKIGETANLLINLKNSGIFSLDAVTTNVAAPDAGYSDTKNLTVSLGYTANQQHAISLPNSMTAGEHTAAVTLTLPGGAVVTKNASLHIAQSSLSLALSQTACNAGGTVSPTITNSGGVDTTVQYRLSLYDAKSALIADKSSSEAVQMGGSLALILPIPAGATDGDYILVVNYQDTKTGKTETVQKNLTISGIKGSLAVKTDKPSYLNTESITGLSTLTNLGPQLEGGNLHLQVTTAAGNQQQKTWTSQLDFQQGVRDGVDTYGVNDWLVPDDDFESGIYSGKWSSYGVVQAQNGNILVNSSVTGSGITGNWLYEGDFDVQVDFSNNNSCGAEGAEMSANGGAFGFYVKNTAQNGREAGALINGNWSGWSALGGYQQSGKLRITRVGSTITGYNWNGTGWTQLLAVSGTAYTANATIGLDVWRGQNCPANARFDNLKTNSGKIVKQQEMTDSVRLLPLNDNFDDGMINLDRWKFSISGSGNIVEQNGKLYLENKVAGQVMSVFAIHKYLVSGDGDAKIDFGLATLPAQNTLKFGLALVVPEAQEAWYLVERVYDTNFLGNSYLTHYPGLPITPVIPTSDLSGGLRIGRTGPVVVGSYWSNDSWKVLRSTPVDPRGGVFLIGLWNDAGNPNPTTQVLVNSFQVTNKGKYAPLGTIKEKYDAGLTTKWSSVSWTSTEPVGTSIKFRTRTAADEAGLATATWSEYLTASGSPISSPNGRWIEVESTLATTNTNVTPLLHDVTVTYGYNPGDIIWQTDVPVNLAQNALADLNNSIGVLGVSGKYYLQGTLTSNTGQSVASAEYPFFVTLGNTTLSLTSDKRLYKPGETVTITGEVKNLTMVDAANLSLTLKSTASGSATQTIYTNTFTIPAGGSRPFTVTTTAGAEGTVALAGTVTQNNATLATMADQYEVASPKVTATLTAPDAAGSDPFTLSLQLTNSGKTDATITIGKSFNSQPESLTVPTGQTRLLQYTQQITADTTYIFTMTGDLNQALSKKVTYTAPLSTISLATSVVTDKISYNPNEQATLTSTVSAGSGMEELSAWISITNSQGQAIYSATTAIPILNQNQQISLKTYWNTGVNPAGSYLVSLRILDSAGTVIGKTTCNLVINSSGKPTALLKGKITPDKQSILTGEIVTVSYSVTNTGNIDLANVPLSIRTVNLAEQTVYNTIADQTTLAKGTTATNSGLIDTMNYSAKDYLIVLRATIGGVEETLAGSYFRVEGAPSAPALYGPASGADVITFTPQLSVSNAADPNDDKLTYEFEVYSDIGLTNLVISGTVPEMAGTTVWTVPSPLTENQTCYWRARAYDGRLYGPWMTTASFRINTFNDLPTGPTVSSPANGTAVAMLTPTVTINNSTDPDSPSLTYNFDLALDPDFTRIVASLKGVASGQWSTSWTIPASLQENGWYYWRAQADDGLMEGSWSATARFQVNTANDAPSAPVVSSPLNGATVAALETDIIVTNGSDPDSSSLLYYFEVDSVPTFDSTGVIRSGAITEGQGTTLWHLGGLTDNTRYHVRVKASDGSADSPWSAVSGFFANTVNDPPTTPALANPSNGAGVSVFTPALSVHNATDLDNDILAYEFELYADAAMTSLIAQSGRVAEGTLTTGWTVPTALAENQTCYWRARATDGSLSSSWTPTASFMVNTANDAPSAPMLSAPADGTTLAILTPTLEVVNAVDPDSAGLTYDFEVYSNNVLITSVTGVPENISGKTVLTLTAALTDNMSYSWRARAFDGDRYGQWMNMATFKTHVAQAAINAEIEFEPETLNRKGEGKWVKVEIELPHGYRAADVDISSIRLEGTVPAENSPYHIQHKKERDELTVKFRRSAVIAVLPEGKHVPVHVTGNVGSTQFEGVDIIRVIKQDRSESD